MKLLCRVFGHRVNRKRVRRVGHVYISRCKWCHTGLERGEHGWHTPDLATDGV